MTTENAKTTEAPVAPFAMTEDKALAWVDDVLEELGHALQACADTGASELLVSAKINGFVMNLMSRQPDLAARAAAASAAGETVSVEEPPAA